jgi:iron(III) transport system substrate-binding protein
MLASTRATRPVRDGSLMRALIVLLAVIAAGFVAAGCGSSESDGGKAAPSKELVIYSGREEELVRPLYERFEQQTGIKVQVKYGESPAMAALLEEEGDKTPADVFYAQDAASIGAVANMLAKLPSKTLDKVDMKYRSAAGTWVGVTGRVRTLVYNTDLVKKSSLPLSVVDIATGKEWKGKVGIAPENASFQAFVAAMNLALGEDFTKSFLEALKRNDVRTYPKNGAIVDAVSRGEIEVGLVNHYYLYEKLAADPKAPIANHFFNGGDIGNLVNVSAVGILEGAAHPDAAQKFVEFMLDEGQTYIVEEASEREYPLVAGIATDSERYKELRPLDQVVMPGNLSLDDLSGELDAAVKLISEAGLRQ